MRNTLKWGLAAVAALNFFGCTPLYYQMLEKIPLDKEGKVKITPPLRAFHGPVHSDPYKTRAYNVGVEAYKGMSFVDAMDFTFRVRDYKRDGYLYPKNGSHVDKDGFDEVKVYRYEKNFTFTPMQLTDEARIMLQHAYDEEVKKMKHGSEWINAQ